MVYFRRDGIHQQSLALIMPWPLSHVVPWLLGRHEVTVGIDVVAYLLPGQMGKRQSRKCRRSELELESDWYSGSMSQQKAELN